VTTSHTAHGRTEACKAAMAVLSLLGCLAGCASRAEIAVPSAQSAYELHGQVAAAKLPAEPDPKDRMQFPGFSVAPPQGAGWAETSAETVEDPWKTWVTFWKMLPEPRPELGPHTALAAARTLPLTPGIRSQLTSENARQGFMAAMMSRTLVSDQAAATTVEGLHVVYQKAFLDHALGYDCFSYDVGMEGEGALQDRDFSFVMDVHSYTCLDPALGQLVETLYSQLVPKGDVPFDLKQEGEDFLRSISFTPLGV